MSIRNPSDKSCFKLCGSCYRCANKGMDAACATCSGRHDPQGKMDPADYRDDRCDCVNGILRWRTQEGKLLVAKIPGDPFAGKVRGEAETADERDYNSHVRQMREKLNDPYWSPVRFENGQSTDEWLDAYKRGIIL